MSYDGAGNLLTVDENQSLDEYGNVATFERKTLTYDVWGQLETVRGVLWDNSLYQSQTLHLVTYGYDVMGRRVKRVCDDVTTVTTTFYDYDGDTLIGEANGGSVASSGFDDGNGGGGYFGFSAGRVRANRVRGPNAEAWKNEAFAPFFDPFGLFDPAPAKAASPVSAFGLMARFQTRGDRGGYRSYYTGITGIIGSSYSTSGGGSSNASYYQYDPNGNTQYEWETAATQRWMRLQGLDAWGRPLNQGTSNANPQPTNVFGNGGYRDPATGMFAPTNGGMKADYNPNLEEEAIPSSGREMFQRALKDFKGQAQFAPGSWQRKYASDHIKQFTGPLGTMYGLYTALTGRDPVSGTCSPLGERIVDGVSAGTHIFGEIHKAAGESGGGITRGRRPEAVDVPIHPKPNRFYIRAKELLNVDNVKRLHGINPEQLEGSDYVGHGGVSNLSNEELLQFGGPKGNDPISGFRSYPDINPDFSGPGEIINIRGGHHRLWEIASRVKAGQISPDALIELEVRRP